MRRHLFQSLGLQRLSRSTRREKAQVVVILAISIIALLAFVGLSMDMAQYLIFKARLRRAVDAAAMAAASHFRSNYNSIAQMKQGMERAAQEALALNGFEVDTMQIATSVDADAQGTPLCSDPASDIEQVPDKYVCFPWGRKKVWIQASVTIPTAFIRLVGPKTLTITADAVGEAASLDLVLALDISVSMAYDGHSPAQHDPVECSNHPGSLTQGCLPFEYVRAAAKEFVRKILDMPCADPSSPTQCLEQDRVAIVLFSTGWEDGEDPNDPNDPNDDPTYRGTFRLTAPNGSYWFKQQSDAITALDDMKLYQPAHSCQEWVNEGLHDWPGVCLCYGPDCIADPDPDRYRVYNPETGEIDPSYGIPCMMLVKHSSEDFPARDVSTCTTTNIGGALQLAGELFHDYGRTDALWVTVLLTDGSANATGPAPDDTFPLNIPLDGDYPLDERPFGYCPESTQNNRPDDWCRDLNTAGDGSRHSWGSPLFDADDYARYWADFVACPPLPDPQANPPTPTPPVGCSTWGQGAYIFAIGMGEEVLRSSSSLPGDPPAGAALLRYIAAVGDDNDPTTDPCFGVPYSQDCGNYYYRASGSQIREVFDDIAQRIFTRLSH